MFLSSLAKTCTSLGLQQDASDFSAALSSVLSAASHTNTMMWIGKMECCPLDLSTQGQMLKHGQVVKKLVGGSSLVNRKWSSGRSSEFQLILFQKTLFLCKTRENSTEPNNPHLLYESHISMNQVRIRDVVASDKNTFEVHKLEHVKVPGRKDSKAGIIMRLECESEEEKNDWVKAINVEVKQLRSSVKSMANQYWII